MPEHRITVKNLHCSYRVIGEGKPLLILHGWSSSSDRWQKVGELLAGQNVKAIIPDLPGFGKSQEPETAWSIDSYADWLDAFIDQFSELRQPFCLLGHSFGGAVAAKFAIKYNQKVAQLFLVSAACIRRHTAVKKLFYRAAKIFNMFSFLPYYPFIRKVLYRFVVRKSDYPYQRGVMGGTYLKVILDDLSYKLRFVKVPTVIIWGDKDASTPLEQADFINRKILGSQLEIIPEADHSLHLQAPNLLSQKILEKLRV